VGGICFGQCSVRPGEGDRVLKGEKWCRHERSFSLASAGVESLLEHSDGWWWFLSWWESGGTGSAVGRVSGREVNGSTTTTCRAMGAGRGFGCEILAAAAAAAVTSENVKQENRLILWR
jgi:hypothetical protein